MSELLSSFQADVAAQPQWVQIWLNILVGVLALAFPFAIVSKEARWTVLGLVLGAAAVLGLYAHFGYSRILGLGHIVFWTPLLIYLIARRAHWRVGSTWAGKWIVAVVTILTISLVFDYVDVIRWLLGDRG